MIHRCSICNRTNSEEVISDLSEFTDIPFVEDPSSSLHYICLDCFEEIRDTLDEFEEDDEENLFE